MTQTIIHQPRVAWDAARAFIRATCGADYDRFAAEVLDTLGAAEYGALGETRARLLDWAEQHPGDRYMADVEAGKWRVRLQDLMTYRPDTVDALIRLTR
jgi:hypothetical protein